MSILTLFYAYIDAEKVCTKKSDWLKNINFYVEFWLARINAWFIFYFNDDFKSLQINKTHLVLSLSPCKYKWAMYSIQQILACNETNR